jgi:hypothetical protein
LSGHSVNSSIVLACGNQELITGAQSDGIDIENVSATLRNINVTSCACETVGSAIDAFGRSGCFDAKWLTVTDCEGVTIVHLYHGPLRPLLEYSNFDMNNPQLRPGRNEAYGVIYAKESGMFIRHCIFFEDTVCIRLYLMEPNGTYLPFAVSDYVISGSAPDPSRTLWINCSFGATATLVLAEKDVIWVHDPCSTRSKSLTRSRSPLKSTYPVTKTPLASTPVRMLTALATPSPSNVFTPSAPFSASDPFSESRTFTSSGTLTPSHEFTGSSHFTSTIQFTSSIPLTLSQTGTVGGPLTFST